MGQTNPYNERKIQTETLQFAKVLVDSLVDGKLTVLRRCLGNGSERAGGGSLPVFLPILEETAPIQ